MTASVPNYISNNSNSISETEKNKIILRLKIAQVELDFELFMDTSSNTIRDLKKQVFYIYIHCY